MSKKEIIYSSIILDDKSRTALISRFESLIPEDWEVIAHHMTISGGALPEEIEYDVGKIKTITATAIGISKMVLAVQVTGYPSSNKIPHVTIAINPEGGESKMSNYITDWYKLSKKINLSGIVTENTK